MINKTLAIEVLNKGLETGADYSEIYYQDSIVKIIQLENNEVEISDTSLANGAGIRLLKGNQCVYGFTSDLSRKGLLDLAYKLSCRFNDKQTIKIANLDEIHYKNLNKIKKSYANVSQKEIVDLLKEGANEIVKRNDPRIKQHKAAFITNQNKVIVYNSKGKWFKRNSEFGRIVYQVVTMDENGFEIGFEGPGTQNDISYFKSKLDVKKLANKATDTALKMLTAKECPSGKMPVVIGPGWGGVLFHEACGHALEASSVSKDLSVFAHKIGEQIASPLVTAYDDSLIPNEWGSIDIDDEGNLGQTRLLIKDGILMNYMIDDFNGRRMNAEGNGACRRQNYKYCPTSRMSNTYIAKGKSTPEEIIKATKLGLYTVGFNGGSVNPTTGEFNFGCSEAYIIRDGRIAEPVKGATLIGKSSEILKLIDMVGNDVSFGQGMCGASSGSIRTNVGQPTIRIKELTVGGRGEELKI